MPQQSIIIRQYNTISFATFGKKIFEEKLTKAFQDISNQDDDVSTSDVTYPIFN
jgi:hypothetical protein